MNRIFLLAAVIMIIWCLPAFAPYDPYAAQSDAVMHQPTLNHLFGTDALGRDVLSRVMHGGARSIRIAVTATLIAMSAGMLIGVTAGTSTPLVDRVISLGIDSLLALPGLLLALVILTLIGTGEGSLVVAIGLAQTASAGRIARGAALGILHREYVEAARQLGAPPLWIVRHHILPNTLPVLTAYAAVVFSYALLNGAALAFLGLGGDPSVPDWGVMLYDGRMAFRAAPWIGFFPGMAISAVIALAGWAARLNPRE